MDKKNLIILFFIFILGFALRVSYLSYVPPSVNWDEVSYGYNALSVMKTGMDQWGEKLPLLNFRAYGDYPTTLNLYLTIPFVYLLGLTEFSIRLPHAIMGALTILSGFFLTFGVTKRKDISLVTAFLIAIGPWHLFPSRFLIQSNLSVFLLVTSAAFFVNREKHRSFLPLSLVLLFLTLFSYHTTRIFSPLFLAFSSLIYWKDIKNRLFIIPVLIILGVSAFILADKEARARGQVLFLIDQSAINRIIEKRQASELPETVKRLAYNRPTYFILEFSKKYFTYFSPEFLFLKGGTQYQFSMPGRGLLYAISLPFFYIGLIYLAKKSLENKNFRLLGLWLVLAPIPASLTNESLAVIRATPMLPITEIVTGLGLFWIADKLPIQWKKILPTAFIIFSFFSAELYLTEYFTNYRTKYSWSWQYGYKEAVSFASENYDKYDRIIFTKKYGEPHEFVLFFNSWDPEKYIADTHKIAYGKDGWFWVDRFDKYFFMNDWDIPKKGNEIWELESGYKFECMNSGCLLVTSPGNHPEGWVKVKTIDFLDGQPAFEIYEN